MAKKSEIKKTPATKAVAQKKVTTKTVITIDENDMKVLQYLKNQLTIKRNQLKSMEMPLDTEKAKDTKYIQELILKNNIWQLEDEINAIEMMLGING